MVFRYRYLMPLVVVWLPYVQAVTPPEGFQTLFNGADLHGWYGIDPHAVAELNGSAKDAALKKKREAFSKHWRVEQGELVNDGQGPCACTEDRFGDMELRLEYQIPVGADSGVYLRGTPEVQLLSRHSPYDPMRPEFVPGFGPGGLVHNTAHTLGHYPLMAMDKMPHNWQSLHIIQIGARTWVTINGGVVVDGTVMENAWDRDKPLPVSGPIMLAPAVGGQIRFRNLFVRAIGRKEGERFVNKYPLLPDPDFCDVAYGPHPKQVLHFWKAPSEGPTPLVVHYHSGGWWGGGRFQRNELDFIHSFLDAGISFASVAYRFTHEAKDEGIVPLVQGPLYDAARALQYLRYHAGTFNIDKDRIGLSGGSAGGCSALWLGLRSDRADPDSEDPVARESTRVRCVGVHVAQTTLDPEQLKQWIPNAGDVYHLLGIEGDKQKGITACEAYIQHKETYRARIAEFSPAANVSPDDPPLYLSYGSAPQMGLDQKDRAHSANYGQGFYDLCIEQGVECYLEYRGAKKRKYEDKLAFFIDKLINP